MLSNYLKIAIRNLARHKAYSFINIGGLAVGILCCLLITLYVRYENSFDSFHPNAERIYRITELQTSPGKAVQHVAVSAALIAPTMANVYPEIQSVTRLQQWNHFLVKSGDKNLFLEDVVYADSGFFSFFGFPLIKGDPDAALRQPFSMVVTAATARTLFGDEDPMGKSVRGDYDIPYTVRGVAANPPENSHIQFDALLSWSSTTAPPSARMYEWMNNWRAQSVYSYVLLAPHVAAASLEAKFPDFLKKYMPDRVSSFTLQLQPLREIHLHSANFLYDFNTHAGDASTTYVLSWIAFFILLIASINFMNLATARSMQRAREVGLRKVVGAQRAQLIGQFIGESCLIAAASSGVALIVLELVLPAFGHLTRRNLRLDPAGDPSLVAMIIGITLITGILSGSYPALFLSSFRPADALKSSAGGRSRAVVLRRGLAILQFIIAIVLIVGTLIMKDQITFVRTLRLGFDKEQLVVTRWPGSSGQFETMRTQLEQYPSIVQVTGSSRVPGRPMPTYSVYPVTGGADERWDLSILSVDNNFLSTYHIDLSEGRSFTPEHLADAAHAVLINETMAKKLGWAPAVGREVRFGSPSAEPRTVIGVLKDFHVKSLHEVIEPIVMDFDTSHVNFLTVRIRSGQERAALGLLGEQWHRIYPDKPFEYSFVDEDFNRLYQSDERTAEIIGLASALAVFVACLGLLGLASYLAERRTKEIGIRKVLGASIPGIVTLLSREYLLLVLAANVLAAPITYYMAHRWLQDFAYRVNIDIVPFLAGGAGMMLLALLTVGYQAIRVATANPVEALRYE